MTLDSLTSRLAAGTVAALATGAFLWGTAVLPASAAEKIRWKVPVAIPSTLPALGDTAPWVADRLDAASGGNIQLKIEEPGKIVPPFQIMEAVKDNKVNAGYTWVGYDQGKIPAVPLIAAVPFGMEPWEFNAWWYYGGGQQLGEELYVPHGIRPVLCGMISPETAGWFKNEITTLDDLKGLKIRFAGLGGKVLEKLGASVTMIPGGEIFQALEKGNIDASEFSLPDVDERLGFYKVATNNYFPGWHQTFTTIFLLVNKQEWDGLEDQSRAMINLTCQAAVTISLSKSEHNQGAVIAGFPDKGVTPRKLPEPILRELQQVTNEVLAEEAAKDEMFARIWESQKQFREQYALWRTYGYLPRDF